MSDHDPLGSGIWARFLDEDRIVHERWLHAHAASEFVGNCRVCASYMKPESNHQVGRVDWYVARCVEGGHEIAAPDGRVLRRSSRHSEQPRGWWEDRSERLTR